MKCPYCENKNDQVKDGKNRSGTQRYLCKACQRHYTPNPKQQGYSEEIRMQAIRMYVDGLNLRRIGRHLGVNHQSVANWVKAYAARLPPAPQPATVEVVEMDELHTFVERKKTKRT